MLACKGVRYWQHFRHTSSVVDEASSLYARRIPFVGGNGREISVDAVYQDSCPEGGQRATVFAQHGSPGSHNDFKYMLPLLREKNIRLVAINYPGHGFTGNDYSLTWENEERNNFAMALIEELELLSEKNLIFLGHSRGGENSLQLAVKHIEDTIGVVLLNCPGLRMHRGIKPFWVLKLIMKVTSIPALRPIMHPLLYYLYNNILGLRVPSGEVAAVSLLPLKTFAFEKQLPLSEVVSNHDKIRMLYAYSGKDFLIEKENADEFAEAFKGGRHLVCLTKKDDNDDAKIRQEMVSLFSKGQRIVTAYFAQDDHFLQKHRAGCIVDAIDAMTTHYKRDSRKT